MFSLFRKYERMFWFLFFGGTLYLLGGYLLEKFIEFRYSEFQANMYQTLVTYSLHFFLNSVVTWRDRKANLRENLSRIVDFIPIKIVLWGMNQLIFNALSLIGFHYEVSYSLTVLLIMGVNYVLFDKVLFTNSPKSKQFKIDLWHIIFWPHEVFRLLFNTEDDPSDAVSWVGNWVITGTVGLASAYFTVRLTDSTFVVSAQMLELLVVYPPLISGVVYLIGVFIMMISCVLCIVAEGLWRKLFFIIDISHYLLFGILSGNLLVIFLTLAMETLV